MADKKSSRRKKNSKPLPRDKVQAINMLIRAMCYLYLEAKDQKAAWFLFRKVIKPQLKERLAA